MDWSLRVCGRRGHETFAPDETDLRARLRVRPRPARRGGACAAVTSSSAPPKAVGPADSAPEVPRGRLLRDRTIMRLLAAERVLRGLLLLFVAGVVLYFRRVARRLEQVLRQRAEPAAAAWPSNSAGTWTARRCCTGFPGFSLHARHVDLDHRRALRLRGLLFVESYGLWMVRRWGEYFSVVATSVFLPWEIYEVTEKVTALKAVLLIINVAAVVWLVISKRLFGVRGGGAAYRAEHSAESLLTVERAALQAGQRA